MVSEAGLHTIPIATGQSTLSPYEVLATTETVIALEFAVGEPSVIELGTAESIQR